MKFQEVLLMLAVASAVGVVGYFAGRVEQRQNLLKCTVIRVVESDSQEPAAANAPKMPYSIVQYSPQWEVFVMPGVLGEEGQIVNVDPVVPVVGSMF